MRLRTSDAEHRSCGASIRTSTIQARASTTEHWSNGKESKRQGAGSKEGRSNRTPKGQAEQNKDWALECGASERQKRRALNKPGARLAKVDNPWTVQVPDLAGQHWDD